MENITKFLVLFVIAAVVLTACAQQNTTTTVTGHKETSADTGTAPSDKGTATSTDGNAKNTFVDLVKNKATTFMVSYDITSNREVTKMTMYMKGSKFRYDTVAEGQESSLFFVDNKVYSCSSEGCFDLGEAEMPSTGTENVEQNIEDYGIISKASRTVAGKTAKCFGITGPQAQAEIEFCYSNEGVPLYTKTTASGQTVEMIATDYSTSISDSVFELPSEPQNLEQLMQQYQ